MNCHTSIQQMAAAMTESLPTIRSLAIRCGFAVLGIVCCMSPETVADDAASSYEESLTAARTALEAGDHQRAKELLIGLPPTNNLTELALARHYLAVAAARNLTSQANTESQSGPEESADAEGLLRSVDYAIACCRDACRLDPSLTDARRNLERLLILRDRLEAELEPPELWDSASADALLDQLEQAQLKLRQQTRAHSAEDGTYARRRIIKELGEKQKEMQEGIEQLSQLLKQEAEQEATEEDAPMPVPFDAGPIAGVLGEIKELNAQASTSLTPQGIADAVGDQSEILGRLNILTALRKDYPQLLQEAIEHQDQLLTNNTDAAPDTMGESDERFFPDPDEAQDRITSWTELLVQQAAAQLPSLEQFLLSSDNEPPSENMNAQQRQQLAALARSMELAVELGPQAVIASARASNSLRLAPRTAQPHQQQTAELLKKIAEPLNQSGDEQQPQDDSSSSDENESSDSDESGESSDDNSSESDGNQSQDTNPAEDSGEPDDSNSAESPNGDSSSSESNSEESDNDADVSSPEDAEDKETSNDNADSPNREEEDTQPAGDDDGQQNSESDAESKEDTDGTSPSAGKNGDEQEAGDLQEGLGEDGEADDPEAERRAAIAESILNQARERARRYREDLRQLRRRLLQGRRAERDW